MLYESSSSTRSTSADRTRARLRSIGTTSNSTKARGQRALVAGLAHGAQETGLSCRRSCRRAVGWVGGHASSPTLTAEEVYWRRARAPHVGQDDPGEFAARGGRDPGRARPLIAGAIDLLVFIKGTRRRAPGRHYMWLRRSSQAAATGRGRGGGAPHKYGVYTRVSSYRGWVDGILAADNR